MKDPHELADIAAEQLIEVNQQIKDLRNRQEILHDYIREKLGVIDPGEHKFTTPKHVICVDYEQGARGLWVTVKEKETAE